MRNPEMKTRITPCIVSAALIALIAGSAETQATVLISNMPGNDGTQSFNLSGGRIKAMGFTMPNFSAPLVDATLRLNIVTLGADPVIRIFDDVGGLPTNELLLLDNPSITSTGIQNLTFTPPAAFTLDANATYWLVAWDASGASNMHWMANSPGITPTGLATHAGSLFSTGTGPNPPTGTSSILNSYEVTIPAPGSFALLGLAGLTLAHRRRRA